MSHSESLITRARKELHRELIDKGVLTIADASNGRIASNADSSSNASRETALHLADQLGASVARKKAGQSMGADFERAVAKFIKKTFTHMQSVRPGTWEVQNVGSSRRREHLFLCEPYSHLADLAELVRRYPELGAALGNSYSISPDILVLREPVTDDEFNEGELLVDGNSGLGSPMRASNRENPAKIVHAVVSCKWTMRSDRAQNTRAEALNLIEHRKARAPHIVAVTGEPLVTRIASLALGTGDIDMTYHFALPELKKAVEAVGNDDTCELLHTLIAGDRLRDISDLPLDMSV